MTPRNRRGHLIDTALALFNRDGFHATGIDRVLTEAGVAKMTLYKHFKSKNDLIVAALQRRDQLWMRQFRQTVERRASTPATRLLAIFHALEGWFQGPDFHGCMFLKATAEYADPKDPIHAAAAQHHRNIMAYLRTLTEAVGAKRPARLAREIMLLMEGAIAVTQVNGPIGAAREAAGIAEILIAQAVRPDA